MNKSRMDSLTKEYYELIKSETLKNCEKEKGIRQNNLESYNQYSARQEKQSINEAKNYLDECEHYIRVIEKELSAHNQQEAIQELFKGAERFLTWKSSGETLNPETTLMTVFGYNKDFFNTIYRLGVDCYSRGDVQDSLSIYKFLLILDPFVSESWIMLGLLFSFLNRFQESLDALSRALQIDADSPFAHLYKAQCYKRTGEKEKARESLDAAENSMQKDAKYASLKNLIDAEKISL